MWVLRPKFATISPPGTVYSLNQNTDTSSKLAHARGMNMNNTRTKEHYINVVECGRIFRPSVLVAEYKLA